MKNKWSVSIFFPVYNEENNIDSTISSALSAISGITDDYEILMINDGSSDGSRKKILDWEKKDSRIRLIDHETNKGYGAALRTGFANACKELVFYTDADMPIDINEIKRIFPLMQQYDLVIGYRINREDTIRRFIYSKIYNMLLRILLRVNVIDANFSCKCIKKSKMSEFKLSSNSVFIDGEFLAEAARNNLTIKQIPFIYTPRRHGDSNFDNIKAALSTLTEMLSYWKNRRFSGGG